MISGKLNAFEHISNEYYQLTDAERRVADYVVTHQRETQLMSISELAEACGVADATISRFCRRLGYKGYSVFKLEVANAGRRRTETLLPAGDISPEDSIPDMCEKLYAADADALAQAQALIRPEDITAAARIIGEAERVFCMGQGGSMVMAMECAHLFSTVRPGFIPVWDSHLQMIAAAGLTERDAVMFFTYSGSTREAMELLPVIRERGAKVILVTRFPKSPAAGQGDVILRCGANETPLQHGSVPARIAQLFLLDVLFAEVYRNSEAACNEHKKRVAEVLAGKHI